MRTTAVRSSFHYCTVTHPDTRPSSVPSSHYFRHMDCHFFHVRSVHELVAKQLTRDPKLVESTASLFCSSCTHHVLRRLVMSPNHFFLPLVLVLKRERSFPWNNRKNRPFVEETAEKVLRRIDLLNIQNHYARSPASGFWLLELGNRIIGLIAVDASLDATNDEPVTQQAKEQLKKSIKKTGTSHVATIRHFFAEEAYRGVNIEDDLLQFAVDSTFKGDQAVKSIRMVATPLRPGILSSLRRNKFAKGDRVETGGIQSWEVYWYTLERSKWEAREEK